MRPAAERSNACAALRGCVPPTVVVPYAREFPVPLAQAYAWLTDYRDDDPQRAGAIIKKRHVVERSPDRVLLEGVNEVQGRGFKGRGEVRLSPPDRWVLTLEQGSVYKYHLTPTTQGCRLEVQYGIKARRWKTWLGLVLRRAAIRGEIHQMWEGFAANMREEMAALP